MKKYILQIIILLSACIGTLHAKEQAPAKSILSPNAASFGLYGEVPVSPFTGTPSIDIPLHDITVGNFKMPISVSYHTSGIRPDDHPSWVGLGWRLNAGGVISRIVNFYSDDKDFTEDVNFAEKKGYYYNYSLLDTPNWNTYEYLLSVSDKVGNDVYDLAPDKFQFNFLDYNGCFYLNPKGEWQVQCNKKVKVLIEVPIKTVSIYSGKYMNTTTNTNAKSFYKFTIIAEDGIQYIFGGTDSSIEYSTDFASQHYTKWVANSWYLTEVILTNGQKISLEYDRGPFIDQMYYTIIKEYRYLYEKATNKFIMHVKDDKAERYNYGGQLISPVYLSKIKYDFGELIFRKKLSGEPKYGEFVYEALKQSLGSEFARLLRPLGGGDGGAYLSEYLSMLKWYVLDNILITDNKNNSLKTIRFTYNYYPRLFLNTIAEENENNAGKEYSFEYYNKDLMPDYLTKKIDHWGFYTGKAFFIDSLRHYSSREPNPDFMKCGILSKINYPTGGYTRFEFEPHTYRKYVSAEKTECIETKDNKFAGGLRISQIINSNDGTEQGEFVAKKYFYTTDYIRNKSNSMISSGVLAGLPQYYFSYEADVSEIDAMKHSLFTSTSVIPLSTASCGSHIGYTEVYEQYPDNSFTRYRYTNFDNGHLDKQADMVLISYRAPYSPFSSKEQERGLLTSLEKYDSNGSIKFSANTEYEKDNDQINYVPSLHTKRIPMTEGYQSIREGASYRFYTYSMRKKKETISVYETGNTRPNTSSVEYKYNIDKLVSETKRTGNNNDIYNSYYRYPCNYFTDNIMRMRDRNLLTNLIEKRETIQKNGSSTETELEKLQFSYNKGVFLPSECLVSSKGSALREKIHYEYDSRHNIIYTIEDKTSHTVYLWGYNFQYPVAEIKNATLNEVKGIVGDMEVFSSQSIPDFAKLGKLRQLLSNARVSTYAYKPLVGLISKTDPNGNTTYFEYDALGRLTCIKDTYGNILETYKYNYSTK